LFFQNSLYFSFTLYILTLTPHTHTHTRGSHTGIFV
jgi:hypothetical protein